MRWELSHRYIAGQIDRATHRTVLMYRAHPDLKFGIEANLLADEIGMVANWRAVRETGRRPAVIFGTSSDRIGTAAGQAYYVTASKSLHHAIGIPVAPYAGASYSGYEDRVIYPFGINISLPRGFSAMLMNDGVHTHLSATYWRRNVSVTLLAIERKDVGLTVGFSF